MKNKKSTSKSDNFFDYFIPAFEKWAKEFIKDSPYNKEIKHEAKNGNQWQSRFNWV